MRVLNTNTQPKTDFGRFAIPGFRSGSNVKKVIALLYYCFAFIFMISIFVAFLGDFSGVSDIVAYVATMIIILAILLTPVIAIGFSDYYDWHGIKLFLIIMIPLCVLFTAGNYIGTTFSQIYINSINPQALPTDAEVVSDANSAGTIDNEFVKEAIDIAKGETNSD